MGVHCPAGKYFIGDPCYAFTTAQWNNLMENYDHRAPETHPQAGKLWFAAAHLSQDYDYVDNFGRGYIMDTLLLGVVPAASRRVTAPRGMHLETFPEDFHLTLDEEELTIGHLRITAERDIDFVEGPHNIGFYGGYRRR